MLTLKKTTKEALILPCTASLVIGFVMVFARPENESYSGILKMGGYSLVAIGIVLVIILATAKVK